MAGSDPYPVRPVLLWKPNVGPQAALVNCPVPDVFFGGARGGGKTEGSLGDWLLHQGRYGRFAQGIFVRRTLPQLEQVVERAKRLFMPVGAVFKEQRKTFEFPNGSTLKFRYLDGAKDAENYQGHEYTRVYVEEATNWPSFEPIDLLRATLRSAAGVPCYLRLTGNPGGAGHQWVKQRYIDAAPPMTVICDAESGAKRVFIPSKLADNPYLGADYVSGLKSIGTPEIVRAWLDGDWNIVSGAYLGSVWRTVEHVVEPFQIPPHWLRWRSMDWGFARPYAVLWFAQDEAGKVFVYRELYGLTVDGQGNWKPNVGSRETAEEVARKVIEAEAGERKAGIDIYGNPADPAIWSSTGTELSVEEHFRRAGVTWWRADNSAGSRKLGAHEVTKRLKQGDLRFFRNCTHTVRTVSVIPVSSRDPEDVDSDAEDHAWDALRYGLRRRKPKSEAPEKVAVDQFSWMRQLG